MQLADLMDICTSSSSSSSGTQPRNSLNAPPLICLATGCINSQEYHRPEAARPRPPTDQPNDRSTDGTTSSRPGKWKRNGIAKNYIECFVQETQCVLLLLLLQEFCGDTKGV
uniref:Uncharacterized protein n=1 Tax=Anopheles coluzzii TaxID=1518534 RepID=A0A8W7Q008_ANOCL